MIGRAPAVVLAAALATPTFAGPVIGADWYSSSLVADLDRLPGLDAPVEIRRGNVPFREVFDAVEAVAGIRIFVKGPRDAAPVAWTGEGMTARETLVRVTRDRGVRYEVPEPGVLVAHLPLAMRGPTDPGAPRIVSKGDATYPEDARRARAGGQIVFSVVVGHDGSIVWIRANREIAGWPSLTEAAVEALRKWRYEPGRLDGVPVDVVIGVVQDFSIQGP